MIKDITYKYGFCKLLRTGFTAQIVWLGLRVAGHLVLRLHSSNEPSELSHCLAMMKAQ